MVYCNPNDAYDCFDIFGFDGVAVAGNCSPDQRIDRAYIWPALYGNAVRDRVFFPPVGQFHGRLVGRQNVRHLWQLHGRLVGGRRCRRVQCADPFARA